MGSDMGYKAQQFESVTEQFGHVFREALKRSYGKLPTAASVARDFNLRCAGTSLVSQESARRWIRGRSMPDPERLAVLSTWLEIDYNAVFGCAAPGAKQTNGPHTQWPQEWQSLSGQDRLNYESLAQFVKQNQVLILKIISLSASS
jgi:hypothetical protein